MESESNKKKKILSERKTSVVQTVNELEFVVDSESENNSNDDDTNDADDEQREEEETSNMTSDFIRILDLVDEPKEKINNETEEIPLTDMSNEVRTLKYDHGEEYRTQNPYHEHYDGCLSAGEAQWN